MKSNLVKYSLIQKNQRLVFVVFLSLSILLFSLLYSRGISIKQNSIIPEPAGDYHEAIAAVISDTSYGLKGYIYFPVVLKTLRENGINQQGGHSARGDWIPYPENLKTDYIVNNAIKKARHLNFDTKNKSFRKEKVNALRYSDLGLLSYVKIAFKCFGYKATSLYKLYFFLLGLMSFIFLFTFRSNGIFLLTIPIILYSLLVSMQCFAESNFAFMPLHNYRYFELIALVPTTHLILLGLKQINLNRVEKASILVQSILLAFIITCRCSTLWCALAIVSFPVLFFVLFLIKNRNKINLAWLIGIAKKNSNSISIIAIPCFMLYFIKHYKVLMYFVGVEGIKSLQKSSLFLSDLIISIVFTMSAIALTYWLFSFYLKKKYKYINTKRLIFHSFLLGLAIILPILRFHLIEHKMHSYKLTISLNFISILSAISGCYCFWIILKALFLKLSLNRKKFYSTIDNLRNNPSYTFVLVLLFFRLVMNMNYHPSYFSNEAQPKHLVYHNAFMALPLYPPFHTILKNELWGDALPFGHAIEAYKRDVLKEKNDSPIIAKEETLYPTDKTKNFFTRIDATYKPGLVEHYIKRAYLQLVLKHPILFIKATFSKLPSITSRILDFLRLALNHEKLFILCISMITLLIVIFDPISHQSLICLSLISAFLFCFSILPSLYYLPHDVIDAFRIITLYFVYVASATLVSFCFKFVLNRVKHFKYLSKNYIS